MSFRNEHFHYRDMPKLDRRVVLGVLAVTFPGANASHKMWEDFYETMAFVRRTDDGGDLGLENIVGVAIVTTHPDAQIHSMRYAAVIPDKRNQKSLILRRDGDRPHHGTELVRYVHRVMGRMVMNEQHPYHLTIDPYSDRALRFYRRAFPVNENGCDFRYDDETNIISIGYGSLASDIVTELAS